MIELVEDARAELLEIADWYGARPGIKSRFLDEVEHAFNRIAEFPGIGSPWNHPGLVSGVRRYQLQKFPYSVVYIEQPRLVVVAVAHAKRKPGYWGPRLREV